MVTLNDEVVNNLRGGNTRAVFGCATHGYTVKGDSTHACCLLGVNRLFTVTADNILGCRRSLPMISTMVRLIMKTVGGRERAKLAQDIKWQKRGT